MFRLTKFIASFLMLTAPAFGQYSAGGGNATGFRSIAIGINSDASNARSIVIGEDANDTVDNTYDPTATGGSQVVLGWLAKGSSWRDVVIGEKAYGGATSVTAVGSGSAGLKSHDAVLGRGAYSPSLQFLEDYKVKDDPRVVIGGAQNNRDIHFYVSNTWANMHHLPPGGVGIGSTPVPSDYRVAFHGWDALDARDTPTQGATAGGHLLLVGGASTGNAEGGRIEFSTTPGLQTDSNCKNDRVVAAHFDASKTEDTRFTLLDNRTGQLRRVGIAKVKLCCGLEKDVLCLSGPPVEDN